MSDNNPDKALKKIESYGLRPGKNWKKILGDLLSDIAGRDGIGCEEILLLPDIEAILENDNESAPKRLEKLKNALYKLRYPRHSAALSRFRRHVKDLALPTNMKITPVPYFESKRLMIEIVYEHENGLDEEIEAIKRISEINLVKEALETEEDNN